MPLAIEELNDAINDEAILAFEATINRLRPAFVNDEQMSVHLRALSGTLARTRNAIVLPQPAPPVEVVSSEPAPEPEE